mmetsp:Transcript_17455/g.55128  ORF Transcript_17455/g.55128 Transcript_17455/m.55128 type:complete len:317 (-) Transcript_17455:1183-2133(-)
MGASGKATRWRIVADTHRSCSPYVIKIARGATTPLARSTPGLVPSPKQTMVLFPRNAISAGASRVVNATMDGSTVSWPPAPANHASLVAGAAILALCRPPSSAAVPPAAAIRCARNLCHSAASMVEPSPASSSTFARARPTSPKPHMTSASGETSVTCSSTGASLPSPVEPSRAAAPSVISRSLACASSAKSPSNGVAAMVTSTIAVSSAPRSTGSTLSFSASASTTNANSPPPDSSSASRRPSAGGSRLGSSHLGTRVASPSVMALSATSPAAPASTTGSCASARSTSKEDPASMKKTPRRMPLNGRMSAWIWAR